VGPLRPRRSHALLVGILVIVFVVGIDRRERIMT
jgi:hypothetical protein